MAKPEITKRQTKGSALTYSELDTNFQNLKDATVSVADGTNTAVLDLNDTLNVVGSGGATVTVNASTKTLTVSTADTVNAFQTIAVAGQSNVVADATNDTLTLVAGTGITLTTDAATDSVTITSAGVGTVNSGAANALAFYPSAGTTVDDTTIAHIASGHLSTIGATTLRLSTNSNTNSSMISIQDGLAGSIVLAPAPTGPGKILLSPNTNNQAWLDSGTANLRIQSGSNQINAEYGQSLTISSGQEINLIPGSSNQVTIGSSNQNVVVTSNGTGNLTLTTRDGLASGIVLDEPNITLTGNISCVTPELLVSSGTIGSVGSQTLTLRTNSGTDTGTITITPGANQNIGIYPNGTGKIVLDYASFPNTDGSSGQVLTTNGGGTLSWGTVSTVSGINDLSDVTISSPSTGQLLVYGAGGQWINQNPPSAGISSLSDDTSPTLGGDLDIGGYKLVAQNGIDIVLETLDTGDGRIHLNSPVVVYGYETSNVILTSRSGDITLKTGWTAPTSDSGTITIKEGSNGNIQITPHGTGEVILGGNLDLNDSEITNNVANGNITIAANGSGNIYLDTDTGLTVVTGDLNLLSGVIGTSSANTDIEIEPSGSGVVYLNGPIKTNATTGTPVDDTTPVSWLEVDIGGTLYFMPLYQ